MEQMSDLIVFLVVFSSTVLIFLLLFVAKLIFDAMKDHQESRKQIVTEHLRPASRLSNHSNHTNSQNSSKNNNNNRSLSSECGDSLTSGSLKRKSSPTNSSSNSASLDSAVWTTSSASNSVNYRNLRISQNQQQNAQQQNFHQRSNTLQGVPKLSQNSSHAQKSNSLPKKSNSLSKIPKNVNFNNNNINTTNMNHVPEVKVISNSQQAPPSAQHQHHIISNLDSIADPLNRQAYNTVQIVEQTNCKVHPYRVTYCTKV